MNFLQKAYLGENQWYRYVFTLLIVFVATQLGSLPLVAYMIWQNPEVLTGGINNASSTNTGLALMLLSFAVGLFALFFCVKHIQGKKATDVVTGRERVDWGRVLFGAGIWGLLSVLTFAVTFQSKDSSELIFQFEPSKFFVMLLISLVLFPFQTSFEEVLFRGYLMQWAYILFRNKWAAVVMTGILFGLLHGANPEVAEFGAWIALPQYILMGLILGYVAVTDNGMELSLGLHAANNILAAVTCTSGATTLQTHALFRDLNPTSSWTDILLILVAGVVFIWICNRKYRFIRQNLDFK